MDDFKRLNEKPIEYNGYQLFFYKTKYVSDYTLAIVCETTEGEPFATISLNLLDYGYLPLPNEIFFNHDLPRDLKELFCEKFCDCTLSSCEKIKFGPYGTETEKAELLFEYIA